jgi:glycosyltransferase involved in cell wall biosynthesis
MIEIVHFGKYYLPDSGGIESVTVSLAKGAVAAGNSVKVVCFEKTPAPQEEVIDGVKVFRAPIYRLIASQPLGFSYFLECLSSARRAEIVHLHAPNFLGALCALLMRRKVRLLVHWHSDVVNKGLLGKLVRPLERALLRRADCIVATSQVYADASETLRPFRSKIAVVPIGVPDATNDAEFPSLPSALEEHIKNKKIILAVGRLVPYKGFEVLIEAAKDLPPDTVAVIVGGGPLFEQLSSHISAANAQSRVLLTGRLSDEHLHALFRRASLYCLPSIDRAEAFGVVLLEAMARSLPIVATDITGSGVPWVNSHGISGFNVPVNDPLALAAACSQILESSELRQCLADGARQRFLSEFTEDVFINRMLYVYKRLACT